MTVKARQYRYRLRPRPNAKKKAQPEIHKDGYYIVTTADGEPAPGKGKTWRPPPFLPKQQLASLAAGTHLYTLYGGARGPGKSFWLRHYALRALLQMVAYGFRGVQVALFCEDYPTLRDRQISRIELEFPRQLGELRKSEAHGLAWHMHNDEGFLLLRNLDDPAKYQSAEFALIAVDEITRITYDTFNILRGSLRWPGIKRCRFIATANPGGIGHDWVKRLWIDRDFPPELAPFADEFVFVRALPQDNPYLDPAYWQMLDSLPEHLRRAWRDGDWDIFEGQVFRITEAHIIPDDEARPPPAVPIISTFDWGAMRPFSVGWWWVDSDGRLYRFAELYGAAPGKHDTGLWMTDDEIAMAIKREEEKLGIADRNIIRIADPTCFNRRFDRIAGGLGPSTAEVMAKYGIYMSPGDPNRKLKIRQVYRRLQIPRDEQGRPTGARPMLVVAQRCTNWIRTMRTLRADPNDPEDIDTRGEDHCYDETALVCMARPLSSIVSPILQAAAEWDVAIKNY